MLPEMRSELRDDECDGGVPNRFVYDDATGRPIVPGSTVEGHPTIGVGRCLDTHGITDAEADALFETDIASVEAGLAANIAWWPRLDAVRQGVLTNMGFQLGVAGVLAFRHMLDALKNAVDEAEPALRRVHYEAAGDAALNSDWARQMRRDGSLRSATLARQLASGVIQAPAPAAGAIA